MSAQNLPTEQVTDTAGQAVGQVNDTVNQVGDTAGKTVGSVGDGAGQAVGGVGQGAGQAVGGVAKGLKVRPREPDGIVQTDPQSIALRRPLVMIPSNCEHTIHVIGPKTHATPVRSQSP